MSRWAGTAIGAILTLMLAGTNAVLAGDESGDRHHGNRHLRGTRAPATGMTLYEVTETLIGGNPLETGSGSRDAKATLLGFAKLGTPLCPYEALLTDPRAATCTILGTGSDTVSLLTGKGSVTADLMVVINPPKLNSSVHIPDLPLLTGKFEGTIDLSLAFAGTPLGKIIGDGNSVIKIDGGRTVPISATFRLPFALDPKGKPKRVEDEEENAFYMADDGSLIPVKPHERDLGFPTVRVEVDFLN